MAFKVAYQPSRSRQRIKRDLDKRSCVSIVTMVLLLLLIASIRVVYADEQRAEEKAPEGITAKVLAFSSIVNEEASDKGLNEKKVLALIAVESSGNPEAISNSGAKGLMQIMPGTAEYLGCSRRLFLPKENIACGVRYLSYLEKEGFEGDSLLVAYKMGPSGARKKLQKREPLSRLPYVMKVREFMNVF